MTLPSFPEPAWGGSQGVDCTVLETGEQLTPEMQKPFSSDPHAIHVQETWHTNISDYLLISRYFIISCNPITSLERAMIPIFQKKTH